MLEIQFLLTTLDVWIDTWIMKMILFNQQNSTKNGLFSHTSLFLALFHAKNEEFAYLTLEWIFFT